MQSLTIPNTLTDMQFSVGITGVTKLTIGRYKQRHKGGSDLVQTPDKGWITKKEYASNNIKIISKKKKHKQLSINNLGTITKKRKEPKYRIDKSEVKSRIFGYLNQMSGEKMLYFWTITFPVTTSDNAAYVLLNKWLTRLRQEKMLKEYLWIAERQQNGTIHFHMVINQKMNVQKANKFMRASIMHSINKNEVNYSRLDATRYNGVDICKDRNTKRVTNFAQSKKQRQLSNYLTKYITKNNGTFQHLAWHSSRGYSNLITAVRITAQEYAKSNLKYLLRHEKPIVTEWFEFRQWNNGPPNDLLKYLRQLNQGIQSITLN